MRNVLMFFILLLSMKTWAQSIGPPRIVREVTNDKVAVYLTIGSSYQYTKRFRIETFSVDWKAVSGVYTPKRRLSLAANQSQQLLVVVSLRKEYERKIRVCIADDPSYSDIKDGKAYGLVGRSCSLVHVLRTGVRSD